jgi:DNA-binding XRE family transcriptional regulator/tetratricopeptide (TPR) repeat protein
VADSASGRACEGCGRPLSTHNPGNRCQACVSSARGKGTADKDNTRALARRDDTPIGPRLAGLRRARGLTQEQLAESAGLSVDTVRKLEQGAKRWAKLETLTALAHALNASVGELVDPSSAQRHNEPPTDKPLPAWALRLTELRRARAWSAADLACELKKRRGDLPSVRSLAHMIQMDWETGKHRPGPRYRLLLAAIHGANERQLFGDDDPGREVAAQAPESQEITVRVPNLILRRIREQERHETRSEFAEALARTAREMGESVEPSERYVARLEDGDIRYPHPAYRRVLVALCGRPMSELGFSHGGQAEHFHDGHSDKTKALTISADKLFADPSAVETLLSSGALVVGRPQAITEEVSSTLRRDFVALGGFAGPALASQVFGKLESELDLIHMALDRGTISEERTSYLEGVASDLSVQVVKMPPMAVLQPALKSLMSIRGLLEHRQPTRYQVRLVRINAELCTIVGEIMFNIGQFQKARDWYITAQHAAYDIGDRYLADIALAGQAYLPTYSDDPNGVLALTGPRLESNPSPSPAIAWLWGFRARAYATLRQSGEFKYSIEHARQCLERSPADLVKPGIFSFVPEKLAFYEATGAVRLNDTDGALNAADRALSMYDLSETTEPTLAKLERASALAKGGEVPEACRVAKAALLDPRTYHGVTVRTYARRFDDLIRGIELPETREWQEVRAEVHGRHDASAG